MVHPDSKITVNDLFTIRKSNVNNKTFESLAVPSHIATKLFRLGKKIEIDIYIGRLFTKICVVDYPAFPVYAPNIDRDMDSVFEHWSEVLCDLLGLYI